MAMGKISMTSLYPELATHGVILCVALRYNISNQFAFIKVNSLCSKVIIPKDIQYYRRQYQEYAQPLKEEQRDLIRIEVGET
jgi:hypothetical protein